MSKGEKYQNRVELVPGILDMLILQTLQWVPQHGYGIRSASEPDRVTCSRSKRARYSWRSSGSRNNDEFKSERTPEHNHRAKYDKLRASGRKQLAAEDERWRRVSAAIASLMQPRESGGAV